MNLFIKVANVSSECRPGTKDVIPVATNNASPFLVLEMYPRAGTPANCRWKLETTQSRRLLLSATHVACNKTTGDLFEYYEIINGRKINLFESCDVRSPKFVLSRTNSVIIRYEVDKYSAGESFFEVFVEGKSCHLFELGQRM